MNSTIFASGIFLLLISLSQIEAFALHPLGQRSLKSPLNVNKAKEESAGVMKLEGHHSALQFEDDENFSNIIGSISTPDDTFRNDIITTKIASMDSCSNDKQWSRNQFLTFGLAASAATSWSSFPEASNAKLYSENAANMERINNGDFSGGAVYNNKPDTDRGKKRRAMTGCKVAMSREEASKNILERNKVMSEKECNTMVMDGETEFMLKALRNLDCPTCANGIGKAD